MLKIRLCIAFVFTVIRLSAQSEIWGTVSNGGQFGHGYIFKTDSVGNDLTIVHHFDSVNGKNPGALLAASGNKLYGLTSAGGLNAQGLFAGGVFYEYDLNTSVFTVLQHFGPNNADITGSRPAGDGYRTLTEVSSGLIYGQIRGAYQGGVIFAFNAATRVTERVLTLPTYQGGNTNSTLGNRLEGNLYPAPDGFLYGTTYTNSQCPIPNPNLGSVIRIDPLTHDFSIRYLCPCNASNGFQFDNQFAGYGGRLYSVAKMGGANNKGVIYSFDPSTSAYVNLYNFQGGMLGQQPSTMVKAANGKFYGTADGGTPEPFLASGGGILFEFDPVSNQFAKKADFVYGNGSYQNVGPYPFSLIDGNNGKLYGVTPNGVFEYDPVLNQTLPKGRFPVNMGWYSPGTPSLTAVCRKPAYASFQDTTVTVCTGTDFTFTLQSGNATSIVWKLDGNPVPSQTGPTLSLTGIGENESGAWTAELTNACGTTTTPPIRLNLPPEIQITEEERTLKVTSGGDAFRWINCATQTPVAGAEDSAFMPENNGSYAVEVTTGACVDTSACVLFSGLWGMAENAAPPVVLHPNPAHDILYITSETGIYSATVLNTVGQTVLMRRYENGIDISALPRGLYVISVQTARGEWKCKFIKL